MRNKKNKQHSPVEEFSEYEHFNAEPSKHRPRPNNIPMLNMNQVEPNSFTERNSDSDKEEISF